MAKMARAAMSLFGTALAGRYMSVRVEWADTAPAGATPIGTHGLGRACLVLRVYERSKVLDEVAEDEIGTFYWVGAR